MDNNNPDMEEAVGLGFKPTEEELVIYYLRTKIHDDKNVDDDMIHLPVIDIHSTPPWDIPKAIIGSSPFQNDPDEVYFFCRIRFMNSSRKKVQRKDEFGSWKCTGRVRTVKTRDGKTAIGWKYILVYKKVDDPEGAPTEYTIHEYHLNDDLAEDAPSDTRDFVLCALKRNWDKLAKGCSPTKKSKGKRVLEVTNKETRRVKKYKAAVRGSPNSILCPEFGPAGCNAINASEKQIAKEPIAEIMQKNITVSTSSAIESPQSILSPSLHSPNTSPALPPIICAFMIGEEAPFPNMEVLSSNEVSPKKPETPNEVYTGDTTTTCEANPASALITGTKIANGLSIKVPHQDFVESDHPFPSANINDFPLHHLQTESGAEDELSEDLQRYLSTYEPPPNIFQILGNSSCCVLSNG